MFPTYNLFDCKVTRKIPATKIFSLDLYPGTDFFTERIKSFSRSGGAAEQEANVRCAVSDLTQDGFTVVSIGIDFEYDPSAMYENHVNMTDLPGLAPDLGRLLLQRSAGTTLRCSLHRPLFTGPPRPAPQVNFVRKY